MEKNIKRKEMMSWFKSIVLAIGIAFVIRTFVFAPYLVEGASMNPTLHNGERIFVSKLHSFNEIKRGEIVIISGETEEKNYVKRVIGLPGDSIVMADDKLLINGKEVKETYLTSNLQFAQQQGGLLTGDFGPITVPKSQYFVMGDNRLQSMDSRNGLGLISEKRIIGKTEFVFYPFEDLRGVK